MDVKIGTHRLWFTLLEPRKANFKILFGSCPNALANFYESSGKWGFGCNLLAPTLPNLLQNEMLLGSADGVRAFISDCCHADRARIRKQETSSPATTFQHLVTTPTKFVPFIKFDTI